MSSDFRPLTKKSLSEQNILDLKMHNIDPEYVRASLFPRKWRCDVSTFPKQWKFTDNGYSGLNVNVDPAITFYSTVHEISREAFKYELEATGPGKLEAGVTFLDASDLTFIKEVPRSSDGAFHFSYEAPEGTANLIIVRLRISGEINLLQAKLSVKIGDKSSVGEGTLTEISFMPPVANIEEDNCYFTADFKVKQTLEGKTLPPVVRVLLPGVLRRELASGAFFNRNSKCRFTIKPYEDASEEQRAMRQINSLPDDSTPLYIAAEILDLSNFSRKGTVPLETSGVVSADFISRFQEEDDDIAAKTEEQSTQFINAQVAAFLGERKKMEEDSLTKLSRNFKSSWSKKYAELEKLEDGRGWFFDGNSGWALPEDYDITEHNGISKPVLNTLTSFRDFLYAHGCRLLVQIVPSPESVAARRILTEFAAEPDFASLQVMQQLLKSGVECIPAYSVLFSADTENTPEFFLYSLNNALNNDAQDVLVAQVSKYLKTQFPENSFPAELTDDDFELRWRAIVYQNEMQKWPNDVKFKKDLADVLMSVREIYVRKTQFNYNADSPILLIGNTILHEPTATSTYAACLAKQLKTVPDGVAIYGKLGWVNAMKRVYANPERFLNDKKIVIFPVYADDLCIRHNTPDFHEFDNANLAYRGKTFLKELKITDLRTNINTIKFPQKNRTVWRNFLFAAAYNATFTEDKLTKKLHPVIIPELYRNKKDMICRIHAAVHFSTPDAVITVNGKDYKIYASSPEEPQWQRIDVPLKPGTEEIKITMNAVSQDAIIGIRDVRLYALKESQKTNK